LKAEKEAPPPAQREILMGNDEFYFKISIGKFTDYGLKIIWFLFALDLNMN